MFELLIYSYVNVTRKIFDIIINEIYAYISLDNYLSQEIRYFEQTINIFDNSYFNIKEHGIY